MESKSKFSTVGLRKRQKKQLEDLSECLGKSQTEILAQFINGLHSLLSLYKRYGNLDYRFYPIEKQIVITFSESKVVTLAKIEGELGK